MAEEQAPPEHLLTPADVAALVFVDPKTVSRWASAGKISATRTLGGHRRFRESDVQALLSRMRRQDVLNEEVVSTVLDKRTSSMAPEARPDGKGTVNRTGQPASTSAARDVDHAAADAVMAEAVAIALETQAEAAAEAVLETAASVAVAAKTAAAAAMKAREARALAAAEAARVTASEAARAAAAMRSQATAQAACVADAAAQARRDVVSLGTETDTAIAATRVAATVQAAADRASADTALAAARVAQAVADAAAHVALMVAAFDRACENEAAAAADALHSLSLQTAQHVAERNCVVARRASRRRGLHP